MVRSLIFRRNAGFFGNLGQSMAKIVPKEHKFFQIVKPIGFETAPERISQKNSESIFTLENLNIPKKIWNFYFDGITRRTRVAAIQKDLAYGGMYDFHVYTKTKGRLFQAPPSFFKKDKALYFPNFKAKALTGERRELLDVFDDAKLTILRVYSTDAGYEMTDDYFKIPGSSDNYTSETGVAVLKQQNPDVQIVELVLSESASKHFVHTFVTPSKVAATRPKSQHDKYLVALRDSVLDRSQREKLLLTNAYSGYVYIIDSNYKVRWAGSGWPDEKEVEGMWKAIRGLSKEKNFKLVN